MHPMALQLALQQCVYCQAMAEKHIAMQLLQKIGLLQRIHYRAFHFRQVEADLHRLQTPVHGEQHIQCTQIDFVDCCTQQDHVAYAWP